MTNYTIIASNGRWQIEATNVRIAKNNFKADYPYTYIALVIETDKAPKVLNYEEYFELSWAGLTLKQILIVDQIIDRITK